jgi:transposase-like protein
MEYKCPVCGKTYTDLDKFVSCVNSCRDLEKARKNLEARKEKDSKVKAVKQKLMAAYDEYMRLTKELYELDPTAAYDGVIYEINWPNFDWSLFRL